MKFIIEVDQTGELRPITTKPYTVKNLKHYVLSVKGLNKAGCRIIMDEDSEESGVYAFKDGKVCKSFVRSHLGYIVVLCFWLAIQLVYQQGFIFVDRPLQRAFDLSPDDHWIHLTQKEDTFRALGMAGIEPTPSSQRTRLGPRFRLNHSAKGAVY